MSESPEQPFEPKASLDSKPLEKLIEKVNLERSAEFIDGLAQILREGGDYSKFESLPIEYGNTDPNFFNSPQIAAVLTIVRRESAVNPREGILTPETKILLCKRALDNPWQPGTWAVPMGKIEAGLDVKRPDQTIEETVVAGALRELNEEVSKDTTDDVTWVAGSFRDMATKNNIHVVISQIAENLSSKESFITAELPATTEEQEHSELGWIRMKNLMQAEPISDGVKKVLLIALEDIKKRNGKNQEMRHAGT